MSVESTPLPPTIAKVLTRFRAMTREEKMQALVHYSKKLEPLPEQFRDVDRGAFTVPECQTRVDLFPQFVDPSRGSVLAHEVVGWAVGLQYLVRPGWRRRASVKAAE